MEKLMNNRSNIKKIALIILIIISFNVIVPTVSNAGILMTSLLRKPLAGLVLLWFNTLNIRLGVMFATDDIINNFKNGFKEDRF